MISKIIQAFWLVLYSWAKTCAQMTSPLTTYRFHVTVGLYSTRSQEKSKFGKNISNTLDRTSCTPFLFLANFDVIYVLILNRLTATWNVLVEQTQGSRESICWIGILYGDYQLLVYTKKQWILLKAHSDWLFKLRISFVSYLPATRAIFVRENIINVAGKNELKLSFCATLTHCFSVY